MYVCYRLLCIHVAMAVSLSVLYNSEVLTTQVMRARGRDALVNIISNLVLLFFYTANNVV